MVLKSTHQIPIFRFRDGFEALRKNHEHLKEALRALKNNAAILIFIEGSNSNIRRLRPFQKGLGRLANSFIHTHPEKNLGILPVTINFSNEGRFRSSVAIVVHPVEDPKEYFEIDENPNKGIRALNKKLYSTMLDTTIHIEDNEAHDPLFNRWFPQIMYNEFPENNGVSQDLSMLEKGRKLASILNEQFPANIYEAITNTEVNEEQNELRLWGIKNLSRDNLLVKLLSPFILLSGIINFLPIYTAKKIADNKVKLPIFYSSVLMAASLAMYTLYVIILIILSAIFSPWILFIILLLPIGIRLLLFFYDVQQKNKYFRNQKAIMSGKQVSSILNHFNN